MKFKGKCKQNTRKTNKNNSHRKIKLDNIHNQVDLWKRPVNKIALNCKVTTKANVTGIMQVLHNISTITAPNKLLMLWGSSHYQRLHSKEVQVRRRCENSRSVTSGLWGPCRMEQNPIETQNYLLALNLWPKAWTPCSVSQSRQQHWHQCPSTRRQHDKALIITHNLPGLSERTGSCCASHTTGILHRVCVE